MVNDVQYVGGDYVGDDIIDYNFYFVVDIVIKLVNWLWFLYIEDMENYEVGGYLLLVYGWQCYQGDLYFDEFVLDDVVVVMGVYIFGCVMVQIDVDIDVYYYYQ